MTSSGATELCLTLTSKCVPLQSDDKTLYLYPHGSPALRVALNGALALPPLSSCQADKAKDNGMVPFEVHMEVTESLDCDIIALPPEVSPDDLVWPEGLPPAIDKIIHEFADVFAPVPPGLPSNESGPVIPLIPGAMPLQGQAL